jgi:hypothetical protein
MVITGIAATIIEASEAGIMETPLFSKKKYKVTPVRPAPTSRGTSSFRIFSSRVYFLLMKKRNTRAMEKRRAPRVMGGKNATAIFIEIKEKPQKRTQVEIAMRVL